jgi:anti-repressor protein
MHRGANDYNDLLLRDLQREREQKPNRRKAVFFIIGRFTMNNQLQIFENEEFGRVRVLDNDGQPWFVGRDITNILGYSNGSRDINRHVDAEDRQNYRNGTLEKSNRGITIINESGLYSLILSSKLPNAKRFKRWVASEVLPTIRKHGAYLTDAVLEDAIKSQDFAFELLRKLQAEKGKTAALIDQMQALSNKARYCDWVLMSRSAVPVSIIAKDYGMTAMAFNRLLHHLGIQYRLGGAWLLYQRYADKGYTKSRTYCSPDGIGIIHTYWTQKGRRFLYDTLCGCGIFPLTDDDDVEEEFA